MLLSVNVKKKETHKSNAKQTKKAAAEAASAKP